jgi:hypothetical protein
VRISEASDGDPVDESDAVFAIEPAPSITVTSPDGGETLITGTTHDITWDHTGTVGDVKIEYSTNNGSDWSDVINTTANDGIHPWTVPSAPSANCRVRISEESDGDPVDESDAAFTIEPAPAITVVTPNGGETWFIDSSYTVTWTTAGTVGNVKIEYSTNGGIDWTDIIASTANSGTYPWTIQATASANCRVRISEASDGDPVDESDAVFTIDHITAVNEHPEQLSSGTGFSPSPNPVERGGDITFYFTPVGDVASVELNVYDPVGNLVFESGMIHVEGIRKKGRYALASWDLRNMSGRPVAGGTYLTILLIKNSNGKVDALKTLIGIKDK